MQSTMEIVLFFFVTYAATTEIYTLCLHVAHPIWPTSGVHARYGSEAMAKQAQSMDAWAKQLNQQP